jgi:HK97 family phage portal protein
MSFKDLINIIMQPKAERQQYGAGHDYWYGPASLVSGSAVTPERAIRNATVYACIRILAEGISSLSLDMYRKLPSGGSEKFSAHPLNDVLKYEPNPYQTGAQFWDYMVRSCCTRGGAYAEIRSGTRGAVDQLIPLHPDFVQTEMLNSLKLRYQYHDPITGEKRAILQQDMLYIPMFSLDGITPTSPITVHRETIGLALEATEYGKQFYDNKAMPGGIIERTAEWKSKEDQKNFKEQFQEAFSGVNRHKTAVLPYGVTYKPLSISNEDAQYLETRRFQRNEICAIYGVPAHLVGDLERATFSNIEHQDISFVKHTIRPWLVRIEQAIRRSLIIAPNLYFAEFNANSLLRGDAQSRSEFYAKALGSGGHTPFMKVNEVRSLENLNPVEGGDELINPLNMQQTQQGNDNNA